MTVISTTGRMWSFTSVSTAPVAMDFSQQKPVHCGRDYSLLGVYSCVSRGRMTQSLNEHSEIIKKQFDRVMRIKPI